MRAEIELKGAHTGAILLDGIDVAKSVRSGVLTFGVDDGARLGLRLILRHGASFTGEVDVELDAATRDLLMQLGWTPPPLTPDGG